MWGFVCLFVCPFVFRKTERNKELELFGWGDRMIWKESGAENVIRLYSMKTNYFQLEKNERGTQWAMQSDNTCKHKLFSVQQDV